MSTTEICKRFLELKEKSTQIEKELEALKAEIKAAGSGRYGEFVVTVADQERESFKLSEAKKSLTPSIFEKIQAFISVSSYQVVKVVKS